MPLHILSRPAAATGAAVAVLCLLVGCGSSATPAQTSSPTATTMASMTPTASTQACEDVAQLKASLEALTQIKPLEDGTTALSAAIDQVRTDLATAEASASEALKPEVDQVKSAFSDLQAAADGLTTGNVREKAPQIVTALAGVRTATSALSTALRDSCPEN